MFATAVPLQRLSGERALGRSGSSGRSSLRNPRAPLVNRPSSSARRRHSSVPAQASVCPIIDTKNPARFQSGLLLGGALQVVISLLVGFVDRAAMAWPEMVVKVHTLFMFNGCLALILALLSPEVRKSLSDTQLMIWAVGSQLGTFFNGAAHAFMAYTGQGSTLVKSMTPPNGYSDIGTGMLYFCAVNILVAGLLTVYAMWKNCQ